MAKKDNVLLRGHEERDVLRARVRIQVPGRALESDYRLHRLLQFRKDNGENERTAAYSL